MRRAFGIITVVQEGRFRLSSEDGHSLLFALHHRSRIEPQDLPDLLGGQTVEVAYTATEGRKAFTAHDIRVAVHGRGTARWS